MRSSQAAFDLIVEQEVSSQKIYEARYRRPEWPGAQSGPTVGIGYDLGQTDATTIRTDWSGRVPATMLAAMVSVSGETGDAGRVATSAIRNQVDIPWATALAVHKECVLPRWEAKVAKALPNTELLSADCFGVLTSLTFNRGTSFGAQGDRYAEMRAIKAHMAAKEFSNIPAELRSMKRLWPTLPGLVNRREAEAVLFEQGLRAPTAAPEPQAPPAPPIVAQPVPPPPAGADAAQAASVFELIAKLISAIIGAFKGSKS